MGEQSRVSGKPVEEYEQHTMVTLQLDGIEKVFSTTRVLRAIDLTIYSGEIHSILGENGAGKSTLMNIAAGIHQATAGNMFLNGKPYRPRSPQQAMSLGIGMVHQNAQLIPNLAVAENLMIGWHGSRKVSGLRALAKHASGMIERYQFKIDPFAKVGDLSVGEQERVAMLRSLMRGASVLILDEPTATLTPQEADGLFAIMRSLANDGKAVVFITHKLREVMAVSSRVTVLRAGMNVASFRGQECNEQNLAAEMLGREFEVPPVRPKATVITKAPPALEAVGIVVKDHRNVTLVDRVSLSVKPGEIVGVAGVAGNGQRELSEALTGVRPYSAGTVRVDGNDLTGATAATFAVAGVGHIPEDRLKAGMAVQESVAHNSIMKALYVEPYRSLLTWGPWVKWKAVDRFATELLEQGRVSTRNPKTCVGSLSGGNVQRFLIARELRIATSALVAVHPTRGLDVGATQLTWQTLAKATERGIGILLISEDLDEIVALSNRILVMFDGRIAGELANSDIPPSQEELGLLMGGVIAGNAEVGLGNGDVSARQY